MAVTPALSYVLSPKAHAGPSEQWTLSAQGAKGLALRGHQEEFPEQLSEGLSASDGRREG